MFDLVKSPQRESRLALRVAREEREAIERMAEERGLSLSDALRALVARGLEAGDVSRQHETPTTRGGTA